MVTIKYGTDLNNMNYLMDQDGIFPYTNESYPYDGEVEDISDDSMDNPMIGIRDKLKDVTLHELYIKHRFVKFDNLSHIPQYYTFTKDNEIFLTIYGEHRAFITQWHIGGKDTLISNIEITIDKTL